MDADQYRAVLDFERSLTPGDRVLAAWTWGHGSWGGEAEVVRVNPQSIRVKLLVPVSYGSSGGLPSGYQMTLPRLQSDRWSSNNGVFPLSKQPTAREAEPIDFDDDDAVRLIMARELDVDPDDVEIKFSPLTTFGAGDAKLVTVGGKKEWTVVPDDDTAKEIALAVVRQDLEDEPELFNRSFIMKHIDKKELRDKLESDVRGETESYVEDIADTDSARFWQEAEQWGVPSLPEPDEETGDLPDNVDDSAKEALIDLIVKDKLSDPMKYLDDIFGSEATEKALEIAGFDINVAADDAVDTDGWQHFLARYDGESHETKEGLVWWRDN